MTPHGLSRAIRRSLENMKIQTLLTAIAMNLEKLAAAAIPIIFALTKVHRSQPERAAA